MHKRMQISYYTLELAGQIKVNSPVSIYLKKIQTLIHFRTQPFFIQHIRAHSLLPGPMAQGNDIVDKATRAFTFLALDQATKAREFHDLYHVPSSTLRHHFGIPRAAAREIVVNCPACVPFHHPPHVGVNPRGLIPLDIWQIDVTHILSFGKSKYVHVSIDTCSGIIHASPYSGERTQHIITHCLEAWAAWGKPRAVKTDNDPGYTSKGFQEFCTKMQIKHITGLPYNPQGQGIVERAIRSIKELLQKQKGGIGQDLTLKNK